MKIFISQIYVRPGIEYPFSHLFQKRLSQELTDRVTPSDEFIKSYSEDFDISIRMSAKADIVIPEIKGPTVFKNTKDVEYSVFLPFNTQAVADLEKVLQQFIDSIEKILRNIGIDTIYIIKDSPSIIKNLISDSDMFSHQQ